MAINGYFFNAVQSGGVYDRVYNAEDVTSYLNKLVSNGVFPNPSDQLQVRAGTGMQVIVETGEGWINGHKLVNTSDLQLTIDSSDALLNRIDRVIFYADTSSREMGITVKKGTAATNPTAPALTRNTTRYEMSLASVRINKQVTAITQTMITDTRADSNVCGWVSGLINQVDTSTLFAQWQTAYEDYYEESTTDFENWKNTQESDFESWETEQITDFESWEASRQAQFEAWLQTLTQQLRINTYVKEFYINTQLSGSQYVYLDSSPIYTYEPDDVIFVYINGLLANNSDYTIDLTTYNYPAVVFNFDETPTIYNPQDITIRILRSIIGIRATT